MNYVTLIHTIVDPFIENSESILIKEIKDETTDENKINLLVCASSNDIARLIGKKGCVANSIRDIVSIAGKLEKKKVHVKFESFGEDEGKGE